MSGLFITSYVLRTMTEFSDAGRVVVGTFVVVVVDCVVVLAVVVVK